MAIPRGAFTSGKAGISLPGGAYSYTSGAAYSAYPQYYAGSFMIDTGYDDPVAWSAGVEAAEVYGARVYVTAMSTFFPHGAGTAVGTWRIVATPVWVADYVVGSGAAVNRRLFINCECYFSSPVSRSDGRWYRIDSVDWTLYRV